MPPDDASADLYPRKFGKYHLLGPLAQGGMGALYLAVGGGRGLEKLLVIKTVLPHLADTEYLARFRDEAKVVVKLTHGNLIPVFDAGVVEGELFIAMEFVEGRDLRAVWNRCAKKQVAFPIDIAVYIAKELCRGLYYAHSLHDLELVHRDVSPPNVLVSYSGEVKLTDFGLASSTLKLEKTAPGIIYGKVAYMSPEQARGEKLEGRSDMYAAGIVLWELLTGRQLFPPGKDQPQDLVDRAKNPDVMRPSKRAARVPVELDEICLRALSPKPDARYPNCDEMRMALQTWLSRHAPTTDQSRVSTFIKELFDEDIVSSRAEREDLINRVRNRAMTLAPTDELRQLVERAGQGGANTAAGGERAGDQPVRATDPPVRTVGSVGRRAIDRGDNGIDRRRSNDRRDGRDSDPAIGADGSALALDRQEQGDETDLIGLVLDGRYRVIELIGEGGMGRVFMAEHVEIGKRVAVKVLHASYGRMPDLVERFRREARAASRIGHPNIVDVTDSGTTRDGSVYFVMEYLEGVELGSVIAREGALDVHRSLRIAAQICRALAAAHAVGVIHRDLKPENVFLISRDGSADFVKVLDFGIAKTTEAEEARERRLTSPGMAMGTPEYMAPEQAAGRPADVRCDVYAVGAIAYEMISGTAPYQGDNFMEILTKKATIDPPALRSLCPDVEEEVEALVMAAMAREPDDRPPSMEAFEYELNKCLGGRPLAVAQMLGLSMEPGLMAQASGEPGAARRRPSSAPPGYRGLPSGRVAAVPRAASLTADTSGAVAPIAAAIAAPVSDAVSARVLPAMPPSSGMDVPPWPLDDSGGAAPRPAAGSGASDAAVVTASTEAPAARIGWWILGAAVLFGIALIVGFATQERGGHQATAALPIDAGAVAAVMPTPTIVIDAGVAVDAGAPAQDAGRTASKVTPDAATHPAPVEVVKPAVVAPTPSPTPSPAGDPNKLLEQADALLGKKQFARAQAIYEVLVAQKGFAGAATLGLARVAFGQKQYEQANKLARDAARLGASGVESIALQADAQAKMELWAPAKALYVRLVGQVSGAPRDAAIAGVKLCNQRLGLDPNDGLPATK